MISTHYYEIIMRSSAMVNLRGMFAIEWYNISGFFVKMWQLKREKLLSW